MKMNIDLLINNKLNLLLITSFMVLGLYYYINSYKYYEPLENNTTTQCPNMLIEKDGKYHLYNSKKKIVSGVNPITFDNLEDYTKYIEWQNNKNISCPILYLQYSSDAQNNELIQVKPSIFENDGGLPVKIKDLLKQDTDVDNKILDASKDNNKIFNTNMFNGFDSQNQDIGLDTPLDKIFHQPGKKSVNPMDPHWGGKNYTLDAVNRGDFEERYVYRKSH
jgi:hypothetical protein|uniref:Uncharacterized protein n=1 Tax=viral metagenome TaxID=1070528 RepID=A0A6C0H4K1_9ZZZZ